MNRRTFIKYASVTAGLGLIASYPVFIERYLLQVNRYRIPVKNLPSFFEGFTIVHITDLHYGTLNSLHFLEKVIRRANSIPRDLTVCTGHYIHEFNSTRQIDTIWPIVGQLKAPYGVLSILGNHDHWGDTARSIYWLDRTKQNIRHTTKCITKDKEQLWFIGAGDLWEDHIPLPHLMNNIPESACKIVLAHNPDTADTECDRVDLMLSGHTHGGQVHLPLIGSPVLPVKNKNYSFGLKQSKKGMPVFISKGIGWALYPVRFNCMPEIAVLELTRGV